MGAWAKIEVVLAWDAGPASVRDYADPPLLAWLLKTLRALFGESDAPREDRDDP